MKSYRFKTKDLVNEDNNDEFLVTHCYFPGSNQRIDLATLQKIGNHYIGENFLTYERFYEGGKLKELIAPNNFNYFFQEGNL
jgi:hypothetical protein